MGLSQSSVSLSQPTAFTPRNRFERRMAENMVETRLNAMLAAASDDGPRPRAAEQSVRHAQTKVTAVDCPFSIDLDSFYLSETTPGRYTLNFAFNSRVPVTVTAHEQVVLPKRRQYSPVVFGRSTAASYSPTPDGTYCSPAGGELELGRMSQSRLEGVGNHLPLLVDLAPVLPDGTSQQVSHLIVGLSFTRDGERMLVRTPSLLTVVVDGTMYDLAGIYNLAAAFGGGPELSRHCVVCCDSPAVVAAQPCGHCLLCDSCARELTRRGESRCVMCRSFVQRYVHIEEAPQAPSAPLEVDLSGELGSGDVEEVEEPLQAAPSFRHFVRRRRGAALLDQEYL